MRGRLFDRLSFLPEDSRQAVISESLAEEVIQTSSIEGEELPPASVRSSIANRLGIAVGGTPAEDRRVEGVVDIVLDATIRYGNQVEADRLFGWHSLLFPTGFSMGKRITVGEWRNDEDGPMQVVSSRLVNPQVHFEAPQAGRLPNEMKNLIEWVEQPVSEHPIIKAFIAHLWFETLHPFDDGNGRVGRALMELMLARADHSPLRPYSVTAEFRKHRGQYYDALEHAQKGDLDITTYLAWCLDRLKCAVEVALVNVEQASNIGAVRAFWDRSELNGRQKKALEKFFQSGGKITNRSWVKVTGVSRPTAIRDLGELVAKGVLESFGEGRSVEYRLNLTPF